MGVSSIEYNHDERELEELLRSIDRPGDFCVHGRLYSPMPRLEVDSVGTVSFPVQAAQVQALIQAAQRAPYGRGPETVLDTSVRDCWQIDAGNIRLGGGGWKESFRSILERVAGGIGCPSDRLEARLYKLLIYEPGGFFAPHRDTEKTAGMVATLVISLPTDGVGGELVMRHKDRETVADMCVRDPSELAFAAFYADCTHETRPVLEGHRISLVYNLVLRGPGASGAPRQAPDYAPQAEAIAGLLSAWSRKEVAAAKIVWLLDHDYSEAGLSFDDFKGTDAAVARTLSNAAERADCALHAAIVHIEEHGSAEYPDYGGSNWGRYYEPDDDDDVDMGEVYEAHCWLDSWAAPDGTRPDFPKIPLLDEELLPRGALDDAEPDDRWVEEASGNAGVSVEHAYRLSALVLWPQSKTVQNLAAGEIEHAMDYVASELERGRQAPTASGQAGDLASQLIEAWPAPRPYQADPEAERCRKMLHLLRSVANETLTMRFLSAIVAPRYNGAENQDLIAVAEDIGPGGLREFLPRFVEANLPRHPASVLALALQLCETYAPQGSGPWRAALEEAARAAFQALPHALEPLLDEKEPAWRQPKPKVLSADAIRDLFQLGSRFRLEREVDAAVPLLTQHPQEASPDRALPRALAELSGRERDFGNTAAFGRLWRHASDCLLARSATPPQAPRDWLIDVQIDCGCEHCRKLQTFCSDRVQTTMRFAVVRDRREHLRTVIQRQGLDISYETERTGRPYKLICTKTRASYEQRLEQYSEDIAHMRLLAATAPGSEAAEAFPSDLQLLLAAISLAS